MDLPVAAVPASGAAANVPLLAVDNLHVQFVTARGVVRAVEGISYQVRAGEMVALVGESGCGKSVSSLAIMRLLRADAARHAGAHRVRGPRPAEAHRRRRCARCAAATSR